MPVPALENGPWTFDVNNDCSESTTNDTKRHAVWKLKECLIGFSAWSVVASSNGSSCRNIGDGSPDLWTDWASDVLGAATGNPHSWIVLENSTNGEQICFDLASTVYNMYLVYSATGAFNADGSTTNRPTATESVEIASNIDWDGNATNGAVVHAMISSDNKCTRWYVHFRSGSDDGGWFCCLEECVNANPMWSSTHKRIVLLHTSSVLLSTVNISKTPRIDYYANITPRWSAYLEDDTPYSGWNTINATSECYGSFHADLGIPKFRVDSIQDWLEGYPVSQIGFYRPEQVRGGGIGRLQDMYFAHQFHNTYDTYDSLGSREWIKFGCFLVPWNGTAPLQVP